MLSSVEGGGPDGPMRVSFWKTVTMGTVAPGFTVTSPDTSAAPMLTDVSVEPTAATATPTRVS